MKIKMPSQPTLWYCPVCNKYDIPGDHICRAAPEHRSYRGIDVGDCKGAMIPLYSEKDIQTANK